MAYFKDDCGRKFDFEAVLRAKDELSKVEIGNFFVAQQTVDTIESVLDLQSRDEEGLRAVRNAVVYFFTQEMKKVEDKFPLSRRISGITAVIDLALWNKGYEV